jgi:ADP-ribose pyrophosphatase YjhB (NUDIX family)
MENVLDNPNFRADYEKLRDVRLNPGRHSARTAHEHTEMVAQRVVHLAGLNGCTPEETLLLKNLGHVHDIGKICGTARPEKSVELLPRYGITDPAFIELVKYHDTNLPWFLANERGQPPSEKAWRKLANAVNVRLLCLFMVADRVDCPGGWRTNRPLVWFLDQARARGLLDRELVLDDGPTVPVASGPIVEISSGAVLLRGSPPELLLIKIRSTGYELPKGHLEWDETPQKAAARELLEETGLISRLKAGELLGTLEYSFNQDGMTVQKRVHYFLFTASDPLDFGAKPDRTKELHWVKQDEVQTIPLVSEELRSILRRAFETVGPAPANSLDRSSNRTG